MWQQWTSSPSWLLIQHQPSYLLKSPDHHSLSRRWQDDISEGREHRWGSGRERGSSEGKKKERKEGKCQAERWDCRASGRPEGWRGKSWQRMQGNFLYVTFCKILFCLSCPKSAEPVCIQRKTGSKISLVSMRIGSKGKHFTQKRRRCMENQSQNEWI